MLPAWPSAACMLVRRQSSCACSPRSSPACRRSPRFSSRFVVIGPPPSSRWSVGNRVPRAHWVKHVRGGAERLRREWRFALLAGATAGLLLAPAVPAAPSARAAAAVPLAVVLLAALRPKGEGENGGAAAAAWLALVALIAALA